MRAIVQPEAGITPVVQAIRRARRSIDICIFRLDRREIENALSAAVARGVRVRFHLSEPGRVTVRVRRGDHVVRARTVRVRRAATRTLRLHGLLAGSYRVEVTARDSALNRSRVKRARVTVR